METKFNFKSQPCTSIEQSKRLLTLGLKKETADCRWTGVVNDSRGKDIPKNEQMWFLQLSESENYQTCGFSRTEFLPAWSLHRLIEMMPKSVPIDVENGPVIYWPFDKWNIMYDGACYAGHVNPYKAIIEVYEWLIKEGDFNKEYLV